MSQTNWVGKTLSNRYQIQELLGQGGMSAVYKANDPNLNRVVAIKLIHPHLSADKEFIRRFEEEAKAVAQLRHPNIIQVFDFNQDDGTYYMVLEFVPGETLQDRLERYNAEGRRLSFEEAARFARDISQAADYAHQRGMIHRDIKPANVMLNVHNQAILMDFGIAKIIGGEQHTATGAVIGTALYLAPEQIRGEAIDPRVDVYASGVTLFEMLSGKPPFQADSAMTLMMKHLNDPIPDLRELHPGVPDELVAVVEKALAKDRDRRFLSAGQMAAALNAILDRWQGDPYESIPHATAERISQTSLAAGSVAQPAASGYAFQNVQGSAASPADGDSLKTRAVNSVESAAFGSGASLSSDPETIVYASRASQGHASPAAGLPVSIPPQAPPQGSANRRPNLALIGGGIAVVVVMLCAIVGGVYAFSQLSNNGEKADTASTQTADSLALLDVQNSATAAAPSDTPMPSATPTEIPPTFTPTATLSPTPTIPVGVPYVVISDVNLENDGTFIVDFDLHGFSDQLLLDGYHLTFFFDDVPADQVGSPFETIFYMYAGPSPFDKFTVRLRSEEAQNMCALVTKPNHEVIPESGTCYPLPQGKAVQQIQTRVASTPASPTPAPTATKANSYRPGY